MKKNQKIIKSILLSILFCISSIFSSASEFCIDTLFYQNMDGYACFRIPAIIQAKSGRILAFSEARKHSCSDTGDIDLVMRYSDDNGYTWSKLQIVWNDGENVCGNPSPVVDRITGNIILVSTWNLGTDHERDIINGTSQDTRRVFVLLSEDEGISWKEPKEITTNVKKDEWNWYATGPSHGIQLKNKKYRNRIVIPCNSISRDNTNRSHIIYSDDLGYTWQLGGIVATTGGNESTVVEVKNGNLLLNMRGTNSRKEKRRTIAISRDGGIKWSEAIYNKDLEEPICQGNIINYAPDGKLTNTLLFSNPASENKRENMSIKISKDGGNNWTKRITVYPYVSAYSDMVVLSNGNVAILYEHGDKSPYERIGFKTYDAKFFE